MNKIKINVKTKIIGFNFCHGKTALHWVWDEATDSSGKLPESLKITGQPESFITAIAYDDKQEKVIAIGEAAFIHPKNGNIDICLKTRLDKATQKIIKDYVKYIYDDLVRTNSIDANQDHQILFYVGHPSGWKEETVDIYQEILAEVLPNVKVAPESRADLISVIKTNQVTLKELGKSVLVIDIGSSTTDFTLVGNKLNQFLAGTDLGGALIDEAIYEKSLEKLQQELEAAKKEAKQRLENMEEQDDDEGSKEQELREELAEFITDQRALDEAVRKILSQDKSGTQNKHKKASEDIKKELKQKINNIEEIEKILAPESNHPFKSLAKLQCRKLKERYFFGGYLGGFDLRLKGGFTFEPIKDKNQLKKIINQKFAEPFREQLENVKNKLNRQNREPGALFLTGGASRMDFIQDICEELFPNTKFVRDTKREICISRGLALWGKTDYKVTGFLEEVEEFLEKDLPGLIQENVSSLLDDLSGVLSDRILYKIVKPSVLSWQSDRVTTLSSMEQTIIEDLKKWLDGEEIKETILDAVKDWWQNRVLKDIEKEFDKISDKYKLPKINLVYGMPDINILVKLIIYKLYFCILDRDFLFQTIEHTRRDSSSGEKDLIKLKIRKSLEGELELANQIIEETKESVRELIIAILNEL